MKLKNTLGLVIASLCGYTSTAPAFELSGGFPLYTRVADRDIYPLSEIGSGVIHHYFFPGDHYVETRSAHDSLTGFARRISDWSHQQGKVLAYDLEPDFHRNPRASMRFGTVYGQHQVHATPSVRRHTHMQSPVYMISEEVEKYLDRVRLEEMTHEDDLFFFTTRNGLKTGYMPIISAKTSEGASNVRYSWGEDGLRITRVGKHPGLAKLEERMAKDFHFTAAGMRHYDPAPWWKDYSLIKDREDKMCWAPSKHKTDSTKRHYYT